MTGCIVVVTFEPELENLKRLSKCVQDEGFIPVIVDNSIKNKVTQKDVSDGSKIVCMGFNAGIAAAQNAGIAYALGLGAEIIGFLDQDSNVDCNLLNCLAARLRENKECVVAPVALEKDSLSEYPSQCLNQFGYPYDQYVKDCTNPQRVDIVIASGMMTTAEVIRKVGTYDEDFFIDFVDIEWCLRCKKAGVPIYVIPEAVLLHKIGNETVDMHHMKITVHSPIRTYYKVRNSFLLLYKKVGLIFSIREILPALVHNFFMIFYVKDKRSYLAYYFTGIFHGICGVRGEYRKNEKREKEE